MRAFLCYNVCMTLAEAFTKFKIKAKTKTFSRYVYHAFPYDDGSDIAALRSKFISFANREYGLVLTSIEERPCVCRGELDFEPPRAGEEPTHIHFSAFAAYFGRKTAPKIGQVTLSPAD